MERLLTNTSCTRIQLEGFADVDLETSFTFFQSGFLVVNRFSILINGQDAQWNVPGRGKHLSERWARAPSSLPYGFVILFFGMASFQESILTNKNSRWRFSDGQYREADLTWREVMEYHIMTSSCVIPSKSSYP